MSDASADDKWRVSGAPTGNALNDVTHTSGMASAVGAIGHVLRRVSGSWSVDTDEGAVGVRQDAHRLRDGGQRR